MIINLIDSQNKSGSDKELIDYNKTVYDKLIKICEPLSKEFNINLFEYRQYFNDYRFLYLSTNQIWHEHYINNYARSKFTIDHIKKIFNENEKYNILEAELNGRKKGILREFITDMHQHNIWNYYTVFKHYDHCLEAFSFATANHYTNFLNDCLNKKEKIYGCMVCFHSLAKDIVNLEDLNRNSNLEDGLFSRKKSFLSKNDKNIQSFLKETEIIKFPLITENGISYFSPRQLQCVYLLSRGRKYKEIAKELSIGSRAVETHIEKARVKAKCQDNSCLIKTFQGSTLYNMISFGGE